LEARDVPSTLTVLNNLDSGGGSLRDAIGHAKDGDTIVFAAGLTGQTITLTSDELVINNSVDIEGPGADKLTVSGSDKYRVFDLVSEGLTVRIAGLTIAHGRTLSGQGGGAILNMGSSLTLAGDLLSDNEALNAVAQGGAVANHNGATLSAVGCQFIGNQAIASKPGGFGFGGAIFNGSFDNAVETHAAVSGCTFIGNRAVGGGGGVVSGSFEIGTAGGGGIMNKIGCILTVADSLFTGNQAIAGNGGSGGHFSRLCLVDVAFGGGIGCDDGSTQVVKNSRFSYNLAVGGSNASGSTQGPGRVGNGSGGGVANLGVATITNSTFDHNDALGGSDDSGVGGFTLVGRGIGGGISSAVFGTPVSLSVSTCAFTTNQAVGGSRDTGSTTTGDGIGGGLGNFAGSTATVSDSTFSGNQAIGGTGSTGQAGADGLGGGIANLQGSTMTISSCTLSGDQTIGGAGGSRANGGNGFGGGLYNDGQSTLTVTGSTITANQATGGVAGSGGSDGQGIGGGVYFATGGTACLDLFTSLNITGNFASTSNYDLFGVFNIC
jgi:hypothetical protein